MSSGFSQNLILTRTQAQSAHYYESLLSRKLIQKPLLGRPVVPFQVFFSLYFISLLYNVLGHAENEQKKKVEGVE